MQHVRSTQMNFMYMKWKGKKRQRKNGRVEIARNLLRIIKIIIENHFISHRPIKFKTLNYEQNLK